MPPLCKGRCHGISRDGGIVLLDKLSFKPQGLPKVNLPSFSIGNARFRKANTRTPLCNQVLLRKTCRIPSEKLAEVFFAEKRRDCSS